MTDAIAELEQRAARHRAEEEAAEAYSAALTRLLRGKVNEHERNQASCAFFATLAMRLKREPDWNVDTACVDGKTLRYNPEWLLGLTPDERTAVLAHEVMHCSNAHHVRRGNRDSDLWNVSCDLAVNGLLESSGFRLPDGVLFPRDHGLSDGLSAEEYYDQLPVEYKGPLGDDPGGCGGVVDGADDDAGIRQQETEWKIATAQAAKAAAERGKLPGGMKRFVEQVTAPQTDWKAELREFVNSYAKNDYAWIPPNRRFVHMGLYLPSLHSEELGDVTVAVDCSGSIDEDELARFAAEIEEIASVAQCRITVLYHDSKIVKVQQWEPTDGPLKLEPVGGGGTSHIPVFEWIDQRPEPTCVVCLTDLASRFPAEAPAYPVLWASTADDLQGPFGWTIRIGR